MSSGREGAEREGAPSPKGFDPSRAPRPGDNQIRALATEAVRKGKIWTIAEWMETMTREPRWSGCWVAVEAMILAAENATQGRLISYVAREFMPGDTPGTISALVHEADMWLAWRLKDKVGHELAKHRLACWRTRGKRVADDPPKLHVKPDTPERVLNDYRALALELGLRLKWTKPAWSIMVAMPMPMLKGAISGLVDLYEGAGVQGSSTVVTLGALKKQLRAMRFAHPGTTTP